MPDTAPSTAVDPNPYAGLGFDDSKMKEVTGKLADIKKQEIAADSRISGQLSSLTSKAMPKIEEMSRTAGIEAQKLKPWDAEQESAKRQTDPIQAFGSLGSAFGILASAFTHAPMENALNASAAAINAIKAGNAQDYDRAYKAWEANTKQALERHQIEHAAFEDAVTLLKTNMELGMNQMRLNAMRFGNQKDLALLEAGMSKELFEYKAAQQKVALELQEAMPKITMANAEMAHLFSLGYDPKNPTSEKSQKAFTEFKKWQAEQKLAERGVMSLTKEDAAEVARRAAVYKAEGMDDAAAFDKARAEVAAVAKHASGRVAKPEEEATRIRADELMKAHPEMSKATALEQAAHEYKVRTAAPTGNRMDDLKSRENKIDVIETNINHLDEMLLKHHAIAGIGGKITRTGEAIGNILGASETDRAQFRRWILEIQETLPSVLNDRSGRPISSEAEKIEGIVAGLAAGDTNANTLRAYDELRPLLKTLKKQLRERRGDEPASTAAAPEKAPWERDPLAK